MLPSAVRTRFQRARLLSVNCMVLISEIKVAFSTVKRPKEDLFISHEQEEGEREYFFEKKWQDCKANELSYHSSALFLFTPEAHTYFLPAFMIQSIEHPKEADQIPDYLLYHFYNYEKPFWKKRIDILTNEQKEVVSKFLMHVHNDDESSELYMENALHGLRSS